MSSYCNHGSVLAWRCGGTARRSMVAISSSEVAACTTMLVHSVSVHSGDFINRSRNVFPYASFFLLRIRICELLLRPRMYVHAFGAGLTTFTLIYAISELICIVGNSVGEWSSRDQNWCRDSSPKTGTGHALHTVRVAAVLFSSTNSVICHYTIQSSAHFIRVHATRAALLA